MTMETDATPAPKADDPFTIKMEVDFGPQVTERIQSAEALCEAGRLQEAVDSLLQLEKQTRAGADAISTGRLLVAAVKFCWKRGDLGAVQENIVLLSKRRGQLKQAVTKMIQEAYTYVEQVTDLEQRIKLIETLRTVTAGKIYVEIERARLTRTLAAIREGQGDVAEAANILQELQVETYGSMEKREKVDFILEQMRLCLAKKDYIRTQIISKKVSPKYFEAEDTDDLKLKFYRLMIELDEHEGSYLAICRHYRAIADTTSIKTDADKRAEALRCVVLYLLLAPYDNEQADLIQRVKEEKDVEKIPKYRDLLTLFTTAELVQWRDLCRDFEKELREMTPGSTAGEVLRRGTEGGDKRWADLKVRCVEHNLRVMAKYYTTLRVDRMAQLLDLAPLEAEEFLSGLVVSKTVEAKIDRLDGIVHFTHAKEPADVLNDWSFSLNKLMSLVSETTHLITKEQMVHKALNL